MIHKYNTKFNAGAVMHFLTLMTVILSYKFTSNINLG